MLQEIYDITEELTVRIFMKSVDISIYNFLFPSNMNSVLNRRLWIDYKFTEVVIWIIGRTTHLRLSMYSIYIYLISVAIVGSHAAVPEKVPFTFDCQRDFF